MSMFSDFVDKVTPSQLFDAASGAWDDYTGQSGVKQQNKTNLELQKRQQDWEATMANTAVQRRQADLKAAGINPLLAAGGAGAETPSVQPAHVEALPGNARGVDTAFSAMSAVLNARLAASQARKNNADASVTEDAHDSLVGKAGQELELVKSQIDNIQNDTDIKFWNVALTKIRGRLMNLDLNLQQQLVPLIVREKEAATKEAEAGVPAAQKRAQAWSSLLGTFAAHAELITPTFNSAIGAGALGNITRLLQNGGKIKGGGLPGRVIRPSKTGKGKWVDSTTGEIYDE